ncbi:MAG TPA: hypothetical protein VNL91_10940 [Thermoanaerobaculia bacterium]|nr:hypothetical protein [Thermoanaerobaculia bacterium]
MIAKVRPFVERTFPGMVVFTIDGRPVTREALRPRIRAASKRAGIVATKKDSRWRSGKRQDYEYEIGAIDTLAPIRAEVATLVADETSIDEAAEQLGHEDVETTLRWYYKDRITAQKLDERRRLAEILAKALPLE